jgi:iron complex outermembrane receptor protein
MKLSVFLFFLGFGLLYSQNDSINELDEIILRGSFSPVLNSGYKVSVLTDSLLNKGYKSLGNLLQQEANFYFKQNGNGMVSSISLRGTSASQTGVYWNGIEINSALNGQTDFNTLRANSFDELEIRKGGGSVLFGNGAIGGAINLKDNVSFQPASKGEILLGAGSYETYFTQLNGLWSNEKFFAKVGFGFMTSENDYPYLGTDLKNDNGAFSNYSVNTTLGFKLNEKNVLTLNASLFDNDRNLSRTLTAESNAKLLNTDSRLLLDWEYLGDRFTSTLKAAFLHEEFSYLFDQEFPENASEGKSNRWIGKYDFSYFLNNDLFFRAGLELENSRGSGSSISDVEQTDFSSYLLFHHQPIEEFMYNISIRGGASSAYEIPFIYSIDAKYLFSPNLILRTGFSSNYRLPTFNDLYWEPGGNPDLKPEKSLSGEIGIDYNQKVFSLSGTAFVIKSDDLIQWRPVSSNFWQPQNISEATNYGMEFSGVVKQNFGSHFLALKIQYDYTKALDDETDKQLIYVPKHRANFLLDYYWKQWSFNYNLQYVGEVFTTSSNTQTLDAYWLSDVSFSRRLLKDRMDIGFSINNLFDIKYQSVAFRPMPNRNYLLHINFKI